MVVGSEKHVQMALDCKVDGAFATQIRVTGSRQPSTFFVYKLCDVTSPRPGFTIKLLDLNVIAVKDGVVTKLV